MENIEQIAMKFKMSCKFRAADTEQIVKMLKLGKKRAYKKNEIIYRENDIVAGFYLLLTGKVEFYKYTDSGEEKIFSYSTACDEFGSPELFEERQIVNARAVTDCELYFISRDDFFSEITKLDTIILGMMRVMGILIGMLQSDIVNESAESKVSSYLNDEMIHHGRDIDGKIYIPRLHTNEKLSSILRLSRETVSRTLSALKHSGVLEINKEYFLINDYKAIESKITVTDRLFDKLKKS